MIISALWYETSNTTESNSTIINTDAEATTPNASSYTNASQKYFVVFLINWHQETSDSIGNTVLFGPQKGLCGTIFPDEYFTIQIYENATLVDDVAIRETDEVHLTDRVEQSIAVSGAPATRYTGKHIVDDLLGSGYYRDKVWFTKEDVGYAIKYYADVDEPAYQTEFDNFISSFVFTEL